jgi:hypothetical protein
MGCGGKSETGTEFMIGPKPAPLAATLVVTGFAVMACPGKTGTWFELMIGPMPAPLLATLPTTVVEARSITPKEGIGETEAGIRVW